MEQTLAALTELLKVHLHRPFQETRSVCELVALAVAILSLVGCTTSIDIFGNFRVEGVSILASDIEVGESTRTEIFFETKVDAEGDPDGLEVVVLLTPSLRYVEGTSRLYDGSTESSDPRTPDRVVRCSDDSSYVVYDFSDAELESRSLVGDSDFGLKFELLGVRSDAAARVEAAAGDEQEFGCDESFGSEESETVIVR